MYFRTRRCAHEAVGAVACFSEFSRLRNGCKVNVFRWIFLLSVRSADLLGVFWKGWGSEHWQRRGGTSAKTGRDVGKDGADVSVLRANFSLCRSLR